MIYIIIPVYNRKNFTKKCILSFYKQTYKDFKIIIADDGSTDGTWEMLKYEFPDVVALKGDGNLWWTGGTNLAVAYALEHSKSNNDFVLTINNDLEVGTDYLEKLLNCAAKNPHSLISSITVDINNPDIIDDGGVTINFWNAKYEFLNKNESLSRIPKDAKVIKASALSGRGTLIPIEVFHKIGFFSKELPQYGADYEFSMRAKHNGYELIVCYDAVIYCYVDHTGLNKTNKNNYFRYLFDLRSPGNIKIRFKFGLSLPIEPVKKFSYIFFDLLRSSTSYFRRN